MSHGVIKYTLQQNCHITPTTVTDDDDDDDDDDDECYGAPDFVVNAVDVSCTRRATMARM